MGKCGQSNFIVWCPKPPKKGINMHFWAKKGDFCPPIKHFFGTPCINIVTYKGKKGLFRNIFLEGFGRF